VSTIYLSGPISLGGKAIDEEIRRFSAVFAEHAARLRAAGHNVLNPCEVPPEPSWEAYMRHGMRAVAAADLVAVLPRWEESRGARLEVFVARELRIPVLYVGDVA